MKYIVQRPEPKKIKVATFDIRSTKNQQFLFRQFCKEHRIIMSDTFENYIQAVLSEEYNPQIIANPSKRAKYGNICIRGQFNSKEALIAYCEKNSINMGDLIFTIVNDMMEGKLLCN